jgi:copper(I)-binding protein
VSLVVTPDKDYAGKQSSIIVSDAYIREMPPGQTISASFMMLENNSDTDVSLYKVNSDIAKQIELHKHTEVDGIMEMRRVKKITIPAKGEIVLKPGGYHMMLFGIKKGMKSGDSVELKLSFDNDTEQTVKVVVMDIMQAMNLNKKIN